MSVLDEADRRGHQRGERADDHHNLGNDGRVRKKHGVAANHIHTGRYHRRCVDQRGDRRGSLHRIGKPDVERNLRALPRRANEKEQADERNHSELRLNRKRTSSICHSAEIQGPEGVENQKNAENESPIADAIDDERFLASIRRAFLLVPVANEQVRAEPDPLPTHEHRHEAAPENEDQHEKAKQIQIAEETRVSAARLVVHVGGRVNVDQKADAGNDQDHHPRQGIEPERPRHLKGADAMRSRQRDWRNPRAERDDVIARLWGQRKHLPEGEERQAKRSRHGGTREKARRLPAERTNPDQAVYRGSQARQNRYQPDQIHRFSACPALVAITIASNSFRRC